MEERICLPHKGDCAGVFNRGCKVSKGSRAGMEQLVWGHIWQIRSSQAWKYEAKTGTITQTQSCKSCYFISLVFSPRVYHFDLDIHSVIWWGQDVLSPFHRLCRLFVATCQLGNWHPSYKGRTRDALRPQGFCPGELEPHTLSSFQPQGTWQALEKMCLKLMLTENNLFLFQI